jgi:hypothetical protein
MGVYNTLIEYTGDGNHCGDIFNFAGDYSNESLHKEDILGFIMRATNIDAANARAAGVPPTTSTLAGGALGWEGRLTS